MANTTPTGADPVPVAGQTKETAIANCKAYIKWYNENKTPTRRLYLTAQVAVLVLSSLTPVFILVYKDNHGLQALLVALIAIIGGLNAIFRWQDNWVQYAVASELLSMELELFEARVTDRYSPTLEDHLALANFMLRYQAIAKQEIGAFREANIKSKSEK